MNILGLIPLAIFVLCCALIVWVLAHLARQGDERRKMIVGKACANTFLVMVVYLIACVVVDMVGPARGMNAFLMLCVLCLVFLAQLLHYKRKFGG